MKTPRFASLVAVAAAAFSLCPVAAHAQTLRCNGEVIGVGDSRASVLQKCGQPVVKDSFCKPADAQTPTTGTTGSTVVNVAPPCEPVDEWTFNPGYGQFMTTLRIQDGKVTSIKYGDRVK